ncbi:MAG: NAD(P)-dependent dehydrogenase (short-subunit alcohol dehydrogenase family) [Gammaproteobacteria bacterium]|jgi:NAD(P)-dependent dehydrogenase (short-subunit alcohol dehydrogenase family)
MAGNALIVGAGRGNSAAIARALRSEGYQVALAARNIDKLSDQKTQLPALTLACDATDENQVAQLFSELDQQMGPLDLVVFNPSSYTSGSIVDINIEAARQALLLTAFGGFLVAQQAAKRMLDAGKGAIFFTGATASVKGFANFSPFAMGKFALRGLAQSLARELAPKNIHVAHFIVDGSIASPPRDPGDLNNNSSEDADLQPDAIAQIYLSVLKQHRSAWTHEIDMRPWVESF